MPLEKALNTAKNGGRGPKTERCCSKRSEERLLCSLDPSVSILCASLAVRKPQLELVPNLDSYPPVKNHPSFSAHETSGLFAPP